MNNLVTGADQATSIQSPSTQAPSENPNSGEALKNEFITLMVAQIENQDPLNPTDGTEYVAQLAQFSQVESSENLVQLMQNNTSVLNDLQVLSAANLVDQSVSVRTNRVNIEQGNGLEGYIDLQAPSSSVTLELLNSRGEVSTMCLVLCLQENRRFLSMERSYLVSTRSGLLSTKGRIIFQTFISMVWLNR